MSDIQHAASPDSGETQLTREGSARTDSPPLFDSKDDSISDDLPAVLGHEYFRLCQLFENNSLYGALMQIKDVYEATMKFAVLCAAAEAREASLTAKLLKSSLSVGDWERILTELSRNRDIKGISDDIRLIINDFAALINDKTVFGKGKHFSTWRNECLGHGALGFPWSEKYRQSFIRMTQGLKKHFSGCRENYKAVTVMLGGKPVSRSDLDAEKSRSGASFDKDAVTLCIRGKVIPAFPFMICIDNGIYFFDDYKSKSEKAAALNYVNADKQIYQSAYLTDVFTRMKSSVSAQSDTGVRFVKERLAHELNRLSMAYHFVKPDYLTNWLKKCLGLTGTSPDGGDIPRKGVLHLMMERGMGKTSFAHALDTQYKDGDSIALGDTQVRVFYCSRVQLRSPQEFANGIRNELKRGIEAIDGEEFPVLSIGDDGSGRTAAQRMCDFLSEFREILYSVDYSTDRLLLVLDGLDEIPPECAGIFDLLPSGDMLGDGCYILLTSRDPETEDLSPAVSDRIQAVNRDFLMRVNRDAEDNRRVMWQYLKKMTESDGGRLLPGENDADELISLADSTFLNLTMYVQLVRSGIPLAELSSMSNDRLLQFYLERLRNVCGQKEFAETMKTAAAVLTAKEPLTLEEIAALSGRDNVDLTLLAHMKDLAPLFTCIHSDRLRRVNTYFPANAEYCGYIVRSHADVYGQMTARFTEMLRECSREDFKGANGAYDLPDWLTYLSAHIGDYTEKPGIDILRKTAEIEAACEYATAIYLLERGREMCLCVERHADELESAGEFMLRMVSLNCLGNILTALCQHGEALNVKSTVLQTARSYLEEGRMDDRRYLATAYMNRGITYRAIGRFDEALDDFSSSIGIWSAMSRDQEPIDLNQLAMAFTNRGNLYFSTGRHENALKDYSRSVRIFELLRHDSELSDPVGLANAYVRRGMAYALTNGYADALRDLKSGIDLLAPMYDKGLLPNPSRLAAAYINRGRVFGDMGGYKDALRDLDEALRILRLMRDKGELSDTSLLAQAYLNRSTLVDDTEALHDLDECLRILEPMNEKGVLYDTSLLAKAYYNRGPALTAKGLHDEAKRDLDRCIGILLPLYRQNQLSDPEILGNAYLRRSCLLDGMGLHDDELRDLDRCIGILLPLYRQNQLSGPEMLANAHRNRSITYHDMGQYEKALEDLERHTEILELLYKQGRLDNPDDLANAQLNSAMLLWNDFGDLQKAREILLHVLDFINAEPELSDEVLDTLQEILDFLKATTDNGESDE